MAAPTMSATRRSRPDRSTVRNASRTTWLRASQNIIRSQQNRPACLTEEQMKDFLVLCTRAVVKDILLFMVLVCLAFVLDVTLSLLLR